MEKQHGNIGKVRSQEMKDRLREIHLGSTLSPETKEKIRQSLLGNTRRRGKEVKPERFIIDETTGCHNWSLAKDGDGYPVIRKNGKQFRANRYYYSLKYGEIPQDFHVHHTCSNRACVNADHLQLLDNEAHLLAHGQKISTLNSKMIKQLSDQGYKAKNIKAVLNLPFSVRAIRNHM